jgi:tetratricopeptide (TPR) repeat protein
MFKLKVLLAATAAVLGAPAIAADWHLAKTENFTIYSEDTREATVEFAHELERLDEALRIISGIGPAKEDTPESIKVTVFRFGETSDMAALAGAAGSGIGGFFIPRASGAVAFVPMKRNVRRERGFQTAYDSNLDLDPKATLMHEYVHYFMYQHADAPYPLWYSEGFAELFSNVQFNDDHFVIGEVPPWRSPALATIKVDLEKTFDPPAKADRDSVGRIYGHGWLIASHLNLKPERRGQITKYMRGIADGKPPMESARLAFGDLDTLTAELEAFRKGRAFLLKVPYLERKEPEVEVSVLAPDEAARMQIMIPAKRGVDEEEAKKLVGTARTLTERYPNSAAVLLTATEAEIDARNFDGAEKLADRVLAIDPKSVDAAIYRAQVDLMRSREDPSKLVEARRKFIAANNMKSDHAFPLYGYYLTHLFDESTTVVPEAAKAALESAFAYAPFDQGVRRAIIYSLLTEDRTIEARVVGASYLAGNGGYACMLRKKFEAFEKGEKAALLKEVKPEHPAIYRDEAAQKAERDRQREEIKSFGCEV